MQADEYCNICGKPIYYNSQDQCIDAICLCYTMQFFGKNEEALKEEASKNTRIKVPKVFYDAFKDKTS